MRILIYTGKGGVGKTSMAAAAACRIAQAGKKVIVMSTDPAHSLGDSFGMALDDEPREIMPGLTAFEIDPVEESRRAWGSLQDYFKQLINEKTDGGLAADEVLLIPTLQELFSMLRVLDIYRKNEYDVLIMDCAPTGETLSLLRFPRRMEKTVASWIPFLRKFTLGAGTMITLRTGVPKPQDKVFTDFQKLTDRLVELQGIIGDPEVTSMRIVATPERIPLDEAKRSYDCMCEYGFNADALIINRIYPEEALEGYFRPWIELQKENIAWAGENFPGLRLFYMHLKDDELRGTKSLLEAAEEVYGEEDITVIYHKNGIRGERDEDDVIHLEL
ncbi:MAG: ArsA family ATPase [Lachnospiraceae bacterium]|nr:ArsA family ATPase [Lachnospiraceae bacterium]